MFKEARKQSLDPSGQDSAFGPLLIPGKKFVVRYRPISIHFHSSSLSYRLKQVT